VGKEPGYWKKVQNSTRLKRKMQKESENAKVNDVTLTYQHSQVAYSQGRLLALLQKQSTSLAVAHCSLGELHSSHPIDTEDEDEAMP
jgi:hypothetical protein